MTLAAHIHIWPVFVIFGAFALIYACLLAGKDDDDFPGGHY